MVGTIREGKAVISVKPHDRVSKEMEVFYNPLMKHNRDLTVLLLKSVNNYNMQIALPLAGSGIRGIRTLKELPSKKVKRIVINDYSKKAFEAIKKNLDKNRIKHSIIKNMEELDSKKNKTLAANEDANVLLTSSSGFDYIDIDPFGTSNPYLDAAVKRISRNGILAVTNTDTAALSGTYPKACRRNYWATPKLDCLMHETGIRILIRKVQLIGTQYDKALTPVFSYYENHYFRIFFKCSKSKGECDDIIKSHNFLNNAGPLWKGNLWDTGMVKEIAKELQKDEVLKKDYELVKLVETIKEESGVDKAMFFDIHQTAKKEKAKSVPKKDRIISRLRKKGFKAANTHFSGTGIRTNAGYKEFAGCF